MVKAETEEFVRSHREKLELVARNGSKSSQLIAESMLACVPEQEEGERE